MTPRKNSGVALFLAVVGMILPIVTFFGGALTAPQTPDGSGAMGVMVLVGFSLCVSAILLVIAIAVFLLSPKK